MPKTALLQSSFEQRDVRGVIKGEGGEISRAGCIFYFGGGGGGGLGGGGGQKKEEGKTGSQLPCSDRTPPGREGVLGKKGSGPAQTDRVVAFGFWILREGGGGRNRGSKKEGERENNQHVAQQKIPESKGNHDLDGGREGNEQKKEEQGSSAFLSAILTGHICMKEGTKKREKVHPSTYPISIPSTRCGKRANRGPGEEVRGCFLFRQSRSARTDPRGGGGSREEREGKERRQDLANSTPAPVGWRKKEKRKPGKKKKKKRGKRSDTTIALTWQTITTKGSKQAKRNLQEVLEGERKRGT